MKIADIHVDSFGHWRGLQLPELAPGVTVIHGPNEAGKSTLLQLIRAILYGYTVRGHQRFVPPRYEGRVGGQLTVAAPQGRFEIRRHLPSPGRKEDFDQSELSVRSLDSSLQGRHLLSMLLAGVDESIFHNAFAVGLSEMQHLGTLSDTEAARQLYGLASGGDRVSTAEVSAQLGQARERLLGDGPDGLAALQTTAAAIAAGTVRAGCLEPTLVSAARAARGDLGRDRAIGAASAAVWRVGQRDAAQSGRARTLAGMSPSARRTPLAGIAAQYPRRDGAATGAIGGADSRAPRVLGSVASTAAASSADKPTSWPSIRCCWPAPAKSKPCTNDARGSPRWLSK